MTSNARVAQLDFSVCLAYKFMLTNRLSYLDWARLKPDFWERPIISRILRLRRERRPAGPSKDTSRTPTSLGASLICRFCTQALRGEVRSYEGDEFTRSNNLGFLPEPWKVALVASHEVVGTGGIDAFKKNVVIWIACNMKLARG